ncbi:MAG: hypothetical protein IIU65_04680 [Clostridia bacterium]|nr:hypothetical protein [Clostridia bacterium]
MTIRINNLKVKLMISDRRWAKFLNMLKTIQTETNVDILQLTFML